MARAAETAYLGIIPARGGSKRIPRKNLVPLAGRPLLDYTLDAATRSSRLDAFTVSTDSEEIAAHARARGASVPQLRPAELATDVSPPVHALAHALKTFEALTGRTFSAVVLLQPTSPFRTSAQIDAAIERFEQSGADTLTAVRVSPGHPYWTWTAREPYLVPYFSQREIELDRASLPPAFIETGSIYVVERGLVLQGRMYGERIAPFPMDEISAVDIDSALDLAWAHFLIERGLVQPGHEP
jgi:CMP-N,N'-diacetyllegionaminic acid synthase